MKTKRFDFNFKPLQINLSFAVDGSVPDTQNYNSDTNTYTPDYTLTPLIVQPNISRMDKDEILIAGRINQSLANVRWYEIYNGVKALIDSNNTNYEIENSGDNAGRIKIKRNASTTNPLTLQFYAEYTDTRTNQVFIIQGTEFIKCNNSTTYTPVVWLNVADSTIYNPLSDSDTQVVTAFLKLGANECPKANRLFVWEKWREDEGVWSTVGNDGVLDYDVTISPTDAVTATVNRTLMGADLYLRCRALYDPAGSPSGVALTDASPYKTVSFIRRIPAFEYDISGVPANIPSGVLYINPEAKIRDTKGIISNPEKELIPLWYIATNQASGALSYTQVAFGLSPVIKTDMLSPIYGGVLGLDVKDRGPLAVWEDSDGALFEDGDGNLILIK